MLATSIFLLFLQCFQKASFTKSLKVRIVYCVVELITILVNAAAIQIPILD